MAFELAHGRKPEGILLHSCDNPSCCNVEHLSEGDDLQNQHDSIDKGRKKTKLTLEQVKFIKDSSLSQRALAKMFGVSQRLIFNIKGGIAWVHTLQKESERSVHTAQD